MTIRKDLSDLPTPSRAGEWPPDSENLLMPAAVKAWWQGYESDGLERPAVDESLPFRGSMAGLRCDRQLWYSMRRLDQSNPMTVADHWRMATGSMGHALVGPLLGAGLEDGERLDTEVDVDLRLIGVPGTAHADGIIYDANEIPVELVELKTIGGFQFKIMTLPFKGGPRGPRTEAVVQGALMAAAMNCSLRLVYVSLELVSADISTDRGLPPERRFSAEWTLSAGDCRELARIEAERINALVAEDYVPLPRLHDAETVAGATVTDPRAGTWVAETPAGSVFGRTWRCGYCGHRDRCIADGT